MASENKELVIVPDADHVDLYDRLEKIPFDKITAFFNQHLNQEKSNEIVKINKPRSARTHLSKQ
jgi:uncharacterized protein